MLTPWLQPLRKMCCLVDVLTTILLTGSRGHPSFVHLFPPLLSLLPLPCAHVFVQTSHKLEDPPFWGLGAGEPIPNAWFEEVMMEATPFLSRAGQGPFVVSLVGIIVGTQGRPMKLLFELADCGDLEHFIIDTAGPSDLSIEAMGLWMCDSIAGLAHMHHAATVALLHRDLKPDNLLVFNRVQRSTLVFSLAGVGIGAGAGAGASGGIGDDSQACEGGGDVGRPVALGRGVLLKVADMSEARAIDPTRSQRWSNSRVGNVQCMAPQAMQGKFNAAGDVYSWAMCMCVAVVLAVWRDRAPPEVHASVVCMEVMLVHAVESLVAPPFGA